MQNVILRDYSVDNLPPHDSNVPHPNSFPGLRRAALFGCLSGSGNTVTRLSNAVYYLDRNLKEQMCISDIPVSYTVHRWDRTWGVPIEECGHRYRATPDSNGRIPSFYEWLDLESAWDGEPYVEAAPTPDHGS